MDGDNGISKRMSTISSENVAKLAIKHDASGKSYVEGLTEVMIETNHSDEGLSQLESLMTVATRARTVAITNMNSHSSRSHSVLCCTSVAHFCLVQAKVLPQKVFLGAS